jgi:hypothetical protein
MAIDIPDYTWWFRERPVETRVDRSSALLGAGITTIIVDLPNEDVEVQLLEFSSDYNDMRFGIQPYTLTGFPTVELYVLLNTGLGQGVLTPLRLHDNPMSLIDELWYDTVNNRYKMGLARPIRFGYGLKLIARNQDIVAHNYGYEYVLLMRGRLP